LLFALAHLANPGSSPVAVLGLFFAGLLLAAGYLATSRLWLPIGLHLSWNFCQGPVFGFPVSGFAAPSLLAVEPVGPEALTGGPFGPEASLIGILAELIGIGLIWLWAGRSARSGTPKLAVADSASD
jgi:membrane protease YdiL (CAAX protease family)